MSRTRLLTARRELFSEAFGFGSNLLKNKEKEKKKKTKKKKKRKRKKKQFKLMECRYCTKNPSGEKDEWAFPCMYVPRCRSYRLLISVQPSV
jgi:hypothetical protein